MYMRNHHITAYLYLPHLLNLDIYIQHQKSIMMNILCFYSNTPCPQSFKLMFIFEIVSDRIIDLTIFIEFEHHLQCDIGMT